MSFANGIGEFARRASRDCVREGATLLSSFFAVKSNWRNAYASPGRSAREESFIMMPKKWEHCSTFIV